MVPRIRIVRQGRVERWMDGEGYDSATVSFSVSMISVVFTHVCDFLVWRSIEHWMKWTRRISPIRCVFKCHLSSTSNVCFLKSKSPRLRNSRANLQWKPSVRKEISQCFLLLIYCIFLYNLFNKLYTYKLRTHQQHPVLAFLDFSHFVAPSTYKLRAPQLLKKNNTLKTSNHKQQSINKSSMK